MENSIRKRETTSIYEDNGRKFQINSFDPLEGNYILLQLVNFSLPFGVGELLSSQVKPSSEKVEVPEINKNTKMMSKEDFISLEKDILKTIYEVYDNGEKSPVLRENGTYGIMDMSMSLAIKLVVASLAFNFKDFFEDVPSLTSFMNL